MTNNSILEKLVSEDLKTVFSEELQTLNSSETKSDLVRIRTMEYYSVGMESCPNDDIKAICDYILDLISVSSYGELEQMVSVNKCTMFKEYITEKLREKREAMN